MDGVAVYVDANISVFTVLGEGCSRLVQVEWGVTLGFAVKRNGFDKK